MENKLKNVLKISVFAGFIVLALVLTSQLGSVSAQGNTRYYPSLDLINELREAKGLKKLHWNDKLALAAENKAIDMDQNNYFDHISPEGIKAWDFISSAGYKYSKAGENLAIDFKNLSEAMIAWEKSPTHMANMLSENYSEFGFAQKRIDIGDEAGYVYVQLFGKPKLDYDNVFGGDMN